MNSVNDIFNRLTRDLHLHLTPFQKEIILESLQAAYRMGERDGIKLGNEIALEAIGESK